jgi:hypothetical protein
MTRFVPVGHNEASSAFLAAILIDESINLRVFGGLRRNLRLATEDDERE